MFFCISCFHLCLDKVRRFFAQRYSPFDMGDFCVLATRALAGGFAVAAQPSFRKLRFLRHIQMRKAAPSGVATGEKAATRSRQLENLCFSNKTSFFSHHHPNTKSFVSYNDSLTLQILASSLVHFFTLRS